MSGEIINVCVCPSCTRLTTMKKIMGDKFYCRSCKQKFKQYKNGKLIYVPLPVAEAIERTKDKLLFEFEIEGDNGVEDIVFEADFEED